jgi:hypothetical protein
MVVMVWLPSGGLFCGRLAHPRRFVRVGSTGDQRKHSFFVRTIKDWNDLPPDILGIDDYEAFKTSLIVHRSQ